MSWQDKERYSRPLQSLVVSLVSTLFFSRTEGVLSYLNSSTCRFPGFLPRNLCCLVTLAVFSLVFAAIDAALCLDLISLGLAESRILHAASADTRHRTPLISFCSPAMDFLSARFLATLCLSTTSGPGPGKLPGFWGLTIFRHSSIP